ncbi:MAG: PAS domain-containing sensor histidine kinase [Bacteroidia bacterium]
MSSFDDIPKVFAHHAKVKNDKKGDTYEVVYRAKSKSLDYRWLKSRDKVYRRDVNQNAIELVGVARDITQRVEIENELEQSEMLFKTLTESLTVGVYLVRKDGYLFYANGKCSEIMGLPKSKCLGFEWKNNIHPNDKEWVINGWNNALAQNEIFDAEFNWKHNQVYEVPVKVYMRPLDYNKDNIETFIGTIIDLSAQKKIQHAINNQKQDLEQFAYIASHDLKAPLTNMQGLIEMAKEYIKVDAIGDDLLEKINVSLARMRNTITSLNEVIAVKKNLELPKGTIKIEPELKAVVNDFSEMIKQADGQIDLRVEDDLEIEFPEIHFDRIFQNLISNALKYAEPNRKPAIKIKAKNQDNYVRVDVEDNGMGMDLDKVGSKVFGLYQRFTTKKEGKGIGLHLVQSIIKRYHGKIEVHSKLGVGTRFTIFFKVHN